MPTTDPPDIELQIYQQIMAVLLGYAPWQAEFELGNVIRFDVDESNADPEKMQKADGDYPESKLETIGGASSGRATDQTFGTMASVPCGEWVEQQSHTFRLTITSTKLGILEQSRLRKLTLNALRLAGPRLGLDYVTEVSWRWSVERKPSEGDETFREVTTIDIALKSETDGPVLTGAR